jgi:hypothetical protein
VLPATTVTAPANPQPGGFQPVEDAPATAEPLPANR